MAMYMMLTMTATSADLPNSQYIGAADAGKRGGRIESAVITLNRDRSVGDESIWV
jgi:hypothetical protein